MSGQTAFSRCLPLSAVLLLLCLGLTCLLLCPPVAAAASPSGDAAVLDFLAKCPDAYEPNDTLYEAWLLVTNTPHQAYICTNYDFDYFAFDIPANYGIHAYLFSLPIDADLTLFNPDGVPVAWSQNEGAQKGEDIWFDAAKGGRYVILVEGRTDSDYDEANPYSFSFDAWSAETDTPTPTRTHTPTATPTRTPMPTPTTTPLCYDPYEYNNTFETAIHTEPGEILSYICEPTDNDYFSFVVRLHDTVEIWLEQLPGDYDLFLYDPAHNEQGRSVHSGTADEYILLTDAKIEGEYRVLVSSKIDFSRTLPYKLRLDITPGATATPTVTPTLPHCDTDPYEQNDTFDTAHLIVPTGWVRAIICPAGDVDFYRFYAAANDTIRLDLAMLPADYDLYLWSPSGVVVEHSWNSELRWEYILYQALESGEYRAEVRPVLGQWSGTQRYDLYKAVTAPTPTATRSATPTSTPTNTPWPTPTETNTPYPGLDLQVMEIEVNQAIDGYTPQFEPIWNKPTVVRVYVTTCLQSVFGGARLPDGVTVRLDVRDGGGALLASLWPINAGGSIHAFLRPDWHYASNSLNFILPESVLHGTISLEPWVNPNRDVPEVNYDNNRVFRRLVNFRPIAKRLSVAYFLIGYGPPDYSGAVFATDRIRTAAGFLKSTWPIRPDYVTYYPALGPMPWTEYMDWGYDYWRLLHEVYDLWYDMSPRPDHLVGWLPGDAYLTTEDAIGYGYVGALDNPEHAVWCMDRESLQVILSHELLHNYGFVHTCTELGGRGFDVLNREVKSDGLHQVLCPAINSTSHWADVVTYRDLYNQWWAPIGTAALLAPQAQAPAEMRYVLASGVITPTGTGAASAELWPLEIVTLTHTVELPTGGAYCLDLRGPAGVVLSSYCFDGLLGSMGGALPEHRGFFFSLPWPESTTNVELREGDTVLAQRTASSRPPTVQVLSPNGGETWEGEWIVRWSGQDADGDAPSYSVLYTPDGGVSWVPLGMDTTAMTMTVDSAYLAGGEQGRVKVRVTDGFHTAEDASDAPFTVPRKPPVVTIDAPVDEMWFRPVETINLMGQAYDPEDGPVPESDLVWYLWTQAGMTGLGTGSLLTVGPLPEGEHVFVLDVVDSDGKEAVDQVTIHVGERAANSLYLPLVLKRG